MIVVLILLMNGICLLLISYLFLNFIYPEELINYGGLLYVRKKFKNV